MQTLVIHMHGLGDMIMFAPTFNLLENKENSIDVIVFENSSAAPIISSKKIKNVYYCDSSYIKLFYCILKKLNKKYSQVLFTNNFSPKNSAILSFFINAKKIKIISEFNIKFKPSKTEILIVNKNFHKYFRNLKLIDKDHISINDLDTTLHFNKIINLPYFNKKLKKIGIHPGSNPRNGDKRWSLEKYSILIKHLKKKNFEIFIFLGEYEVELIEYFLIHHGDLNIIKNKSIEYVANLINKLDKFISNETGLAHLASSYDIPTYVMLNKLETMERTQISLPLKKTILIKKSNDDRDLKEIINLVN